MKSGSDPTTNPNEIAALTALRDDFIGQWGAIGLAWGINRTMAQIHALLMTAPAPLTTDDVMQELKISRGNAHTNLRDLTGWGLVRSVIRKGERKEYFEAEKDIWKMFCIICRERKRREIEPVVKVLKNCVQQTKNMKSAEAKVFRQQLESIEQFVEMADSIVEKLSKSENNTVLPMLLKMMK